MSGRLDSQEAALIAEALAAGKVTLIPASEADCAAPVDLEELRASYGALPARRGPTARRLRRMGVREVLEWAFAEERAALDFDDVAFGIVASDSCARLAHIGDLGGVRIDTSPGRSLPAGGAVDVVNAVAAVLPRRDALIVQEHAARGSAPDRFISEKVECTPVRWVCNRHGWRAAVTKLPTWSWVWRRGKRRREYHTVCEVTYSISPADIARARRAYQSWRLALMSLGPHLRALHLLGIEVTHELPPCAPWEISQAEENR